MSPRLWAAAGDGFRNAVRGKYHGTVVGYLVEFIDEDCAKAAQSIHDEAVVDDFVAHMTGAPKRSSASSTIWIARSTRRKNPGGRDQDTKFGKFSHGAGHVRHRLQP